MRLVRLQAVLATCMITEDRMMNLLDENGAAELLRLRPRTLTRWRFERRGPAFVRLGGAIRYRTADLEAFVSRNLVAQND